VLPPLQQKYGEQLELLLVEIKSEQDWERLVQVGAAYNIPQDRLGVPFMIVGGAVLIGSAQIPAELPGLIEQHLAAGGIDYPAVPGLIDLLPQPAAPTSAPTLTPAPPAEAPATTSCAAGDPCAEKIPLPETAPPAPAAQLITNLPADPPVAASVAPPPPNGFGLAIGIMAGMVVALAYVGAVAVQGFNHTSARPAPAWLEEAIPPLAVLGLGVAIYLAYVETQAVAAVCGPVGDCNAVQASPYAKLFGVLPVGVLGAIGYVAILAAWLWGRFGAGRLADYAPLAVFGIALFGTLFSLYLTYLEPFVIGAVCIWCLTSAVIITLLMLFSFKPALQVVRPPG
jgi:uncharacterized membrane protein